MAQAAFDTISVAQRLEKEFEFSPKQAEGTAKLMYEHLVGNVATKDDLRILEADMDDLKEDVKDLKEDVKSLREDITSLREDTKKDIQALDKKIDHVAFDMNKKIDHVTSDLKWMKGIGGAILAVLILPMLADFVS